MMKIKAFTRILAMSGAIFALVSCNQKAEFHTASYVAISASSVEVREDAGYIDIPVYAYVQNGDLSFPRAESANTVVTFEVIPDTAVEGENYTIEPAGGVLTFNDKSEAVLRVNVVDHEGIDDTKTLAVRLTGATNGYDLGGMDEVKVNITDSDHPYAHSFGTYRCDGLADPLGGGTGSLELTISPVPGNYSALSIEGFAPSASGVVDLNAVIGTASGQLLSITTGQTLGRYEDADVTFTAVSSFTSDGYYPADALTFSIADDGSTLTSAPFGYLIGFPVVENGQTYTSIIDTYVKDEAVFTKVQ